MEQRLNQRSNHNLELEQKVRQLTKKIADKDDIRVKELERMLAVRESAYQALEARFDQRGEETGQLEKQVTQLTQKLANMENIRQKEFEAEKVSSTVRVYFVHFLALKLLLTKCS